MIQQKEVKGLTLIRQQLYDDVKNFENCEFH